MPFRVQKQSQFSESTLSNGLCNGCCPHQNHSVLCYLNNRYVNSYFLPLLIKCFFFYILFSSLDHLLSFYICNISYHLLNFFAPKWHLLPPLQFRVQKQSQFSEPTSSNSPCNGCCPQQNHYVLRHLKVLSSEMDLAEIRLTR
jgi:hypothetical protein